MKELTISTNTGNSSGTCTSSGGFKGSRFFFFALVRLPTGDGGREGLLRSTPDGHDCKGLDSDGDRRLCWDVGVVSVVDDDGRAKRSAVFGKGGTGGAVSCER